MGKAVIGESAKERAGNKMDKIMERSSRRDAQKKKEPTIIQQLKKKYPDNWREHLDEMKKEFADPDYLAKKNQATKEFARLYYVEVPPHMRGETSEKQYVQRRITQWMQSNN